MSAPLFRGGQGRTAQDIEDSGRAVVALIVLAVILLAVAVAVVGAR